MSAADRLQAAWESVRPDLPPIIFADDEARQLLDALARPLPQDKGGPDARTVTESTSR